MQPLQDLLWRVDQISRVPFGARLFARSKASPVELLLLSWKASHCSSGWVMLDLSLESPTKAAQPPSDSGRLSCRATAASMHLCYKHEPHHLQPLGRNQDSKLEKGTLLENKQSLSSIDSRESASEWHECYCCQLVKCRSLPVTACGFW